MLLMLLLVLMLVLLLLIIMLRVLMMLLVLLLKKMMTVLEMIMTIKNKLFLRNGTNYTVRLFNDEFLLQRFESNLHCL
jgi:hypothetical protein